LYSEDKSQRNSDIDNKNKNKNNNNNNNNNGNNKAIRIASDNSTWWRRDCLADLHLSIEKSLGKCVDHNLSIILDTTFPRRKEKWVMELSVIAFLLMDMLYLTSHSYSTEHQHSG
jgi:hypothetical protein